MAFLRVEAKKSGHYLRIVEGNRARSGVNKGKVYQRTLYSLGKVEDYAPEQLQRIGKKLIELSGQSIEKIIGSELIEQGRYNYGYMLIIKKLWHQFGLDEWFKIVVRNRKVKFDWLSALELMLSERLNEPCSKRSNYHHQNEYLGYEDNQVELHHLYRTLDIMSEEQDSLKKYLFKARESLFSSKLDVVFYDVTTLYFDSSVEEPNSLRQKGFSKDNKAHKTQVVLGLLVDKQRNPISYQIYKGNTYEGNTFPDALEKLKSSYDIDKVIVVADSAMINKSNRDFIDKNEHLSYIIGDRLKKLPSSISNYLLDKNNHKKLYDSSNSVLSYSSIEYAGRRIICTYSLSRAKKDSYERQKLLNKAKMLLDEPSKLSQLRKRGAGRYIQQQDNGKCSLDTKKIEDDSRWDGYKAISSTSVLSVSDILSKYRDLFEVEHTFRALKSQLEIRPMFHWTDKRIEGHIAMCFIAYAMLNYMRNLTGLQYKDIIKSLDKMQVSKIRDNNSDNIIYLRSKIDDNQDRLMKCLKIVPLKDILSQEHINQYIS